MLLSLVQSLADAQSAGRFRFLVIGGYGLDAHHYQRDTRDLDILIASPDLEAAEEVVRSFGYVRFAQTKSFTRCWHPHDPLFIPVDFMLVDSNTFAKLSSDAVTHEMGGVAVTCPSVPGFVALKLHALKNNPARGRKDLNDIAALIEKNPGAISLSRLKELCDRYAPPHIFPKLEVLLNS